MRRSSRRRFCCGVRRLVCWTGAASRRSARRALELGHFLGRLLRRLLAWTAQGRFSRYPTARRGFHPLELDTHWSTTTFWPSRASSLARWFAPASVEDRSYLSFPFGRLMLTVLYWRRPDESCVICPPSSLLCSPADSSSVAVWQVPAPVAGRALDDIGGLAQRPVAVVGVRVLDLSGAVAVPACNAPGGDGGVRHESILPGRRRLLGPNAQSLPLPVWVGPRRVRGQLVCGLSSRR